MDDIGDIPSKDSIEPSGYLSHTAQSKVQTVQEILEAGGVAHVYLDSVDGDDLHLSGFNTHVFPQKGWIFNHADDIDMWISGDNIGAVERHYER